MEVAKGGTCKDFATRLQSDRLIKIYIGHTTSDTKPFLIQQTFLTKASDYFVKAIKHEHHGDENEIGVLRFPEDDAGAWEVLLAWLIRRTFPRSAANNGGELAVKCYILGDRYHFTSFQDDAMFTLLRQLQGKDPSLCTIQEAFLQTPPGSRLRRLMAEKLVDLVRDKTLEYNRLDDLLNGSNFVGEFLEVRDRMSAEVVLWQIAYRLGYEGAQRQIVPTWKDYMVGDRAIRLAGYAEAELAIG